MKSSRINKLFNKIILLLIISIIGIYSKNYIKDSYSYNEEKVEINNSSLLEIYYLNVGQADSILITNNDNTILIDAGNNNDGNNIVEFIKSLNIKDIDVLVGTHPHEDHIGGLDDIIDNFDISKIYMPDVVTTSKTFESVLDSIENKRYEINIPKINEELYMDDMKFKILYTGRDENDLNNTSIIIKLVYGNTSYLFTGDATEKTEKKILNEDIDIDVLKVGHHGSNYSTNKVFLDKTSPKYAIISVGNHNTYNHPGIDTLNKLEERNIITYRTDLDGTIKIISDGNEINIEKLKINLDGE